MRTLACVLFVLLWAPRVFAQTLLTVPTLPVDLTVTWDDPGPGGKPDTYLVTLDGGQSQTVPGPSAFPCVSCAIAIIHVTTAGNHSVSIVGQNTATPPQGPAATLPFTVAVGMLTPSMPTNPRLSLTVSPDKTSIPPAPYIVDSEAGIWTLGPQVACPSPADPSKCHSILLNGVQAADGVGYVIVWSDGSIFILGQNEQWYRWTGTGYVFATDPR